MKDHMSLHNHAVLGQLIAGPCTSVTVQAACPATLLGSLLGLALQVLHGSSLLTAQLAQPSLLCLQLCQYTPHLQGHTSICWAPHPKETHFMSGSFGHLIGLAGVLQ